MLAVTAVTVTTPGSGYTFATISNAQIVAAATSLSVAELDVIIPPKADTRKRKRRISKFFVMLNTSLEGTESVNSVTFLL